jgi:hypothetical protein
MKKIVMILCIMLVSHSAESQKKSIDVLETTVHKAEKTLHALERLQDLKTEIKCATKKINPDTTFGILLKNFKQLFLGMGCGIVVHECVEIAQNSTNKTSSALFSLGIIGSNVIDKNGNFIFDPRNSKLSWSERIFFATGGAIGLVGKGLWGKRG